MSGIIQDWRCWCSKLVLASIFIASLQEQAFAQIISIPILNDSDRAQLPNAIYGASDTQLAGQGDVGNANLIYNGAFSILDIITGEKNDFASGIFNIQVAQGCYSPVSAKNQFLIAGPGGLPPNPKDILTPDTPQIDWVSLKPSNNRFLPPVTSKLTTSTSKRIVEATGATLNARGQIVLSANSSTATLNTSRQNPIQCHGS
ncbi:MAG: hypothetical protein V7K71_05900 [Nostoc sp.]|uniref:hypothetical protein n=1 Tax=Nostoc sp. TaxID=1180 RepID=UPI002FF4E4D4